MKRLTILACAMMLTACDTTGHYGQGSGISYENPAFGFDHEPSTNAVTDYRLPANQVSAYCNSIHAAFIHGGKACALHMARVDDDKVNPQHKDYWGSPSLCVRVLPITGETETEWLLRQVNATCNGWVDSRDM